MAENSKADQIVGKVVEMLDALESIKTVTRKPPADTDFTEAAGPQMPLAVVMGGLPAVAEAVTHRTKFNSTLPVSILVIAEDNVNPGRTMYNIADDIWAAIHALPRNRNNAFFDGLARDVAVIPVQELDISAPYISFRYDLEVSYTHDNRSI